MLLAEDLLLLLTDDATGRLLLDGHQVDVALGGAQLVELTLAGRVDVDDKKRLVVRDGDTVEDELLGPSLLMIARREGKRPKTVVGDLGQGLRDRLYERLTSAGIVRREDHRVLGIFPRTAWPTVSAEHEAAVRRALVEALTQRTVPSQRVAALVALVHALRATSTVVDARKHGLTRRDLDRRAKQIAQGSWASQAVRAALDEAAAAATAATVAATTAATTVTTS